MTGLKRDLIEKAIQSKSLSENNSYSSYWRKWINNFDFMNPADHLQKIYGDYFTPVRWRSGNFLLRQLVALELVIMNLLSSPKSFIKAIIKPSYWRLRKVCSNQGRHMNYANIIAISAFNLICKQIKPKQLTICVIGDGASNFVAMSLMDSTKFKKIVSVNLSEIHLVETEMLFKVGISESQMLIVDSEESALRFSQSDAKVAIVSADDAKCLSSLKIDIFVNMSSMQEMTKEAISEYFGLIKKSSAYFYCCNREEKVLPDGAVIRFSEYPWSNAKFVFNEVCPWMKKTINLTRPVIRRQEIHRHALVKYS